MHLLFPGAHQDKTQYISVMEARRNVKMVLFERRDPNLKDIKVFGCFRLTEAEVQLGM